MKLVLSPKFLAIGFMLMCTAVIAGKDDDDCFKLLPGETYHGLSWTPEDNGGGLLSNSENHQVTVYAPGSDEKLETSEGTECIGSSLVHSGSEESDLFLWISIAGHH
ncbi:uncharacterized protein MELLADRAFT_108141 [Melampsora larici-populina 98AG31]|uniref:Secreted protein n=1 Tax=Melampsora larici-populina (strain 98AG31 / pathotype 3-4-7) TaxID=747676 RepID=F4RS37_MELLP|nr:uncharacterized protein MELLADRAFT_108141 [Melampsora larici-populina 98AG31]EGG04844.1 secreted protein [Melampsora larici-populina 98AG31]